MSDKKEPVTQILADIASTKEELNAKDVMKLQKNTLQLLFEGKITPVMVNAINKGLNNYVGTVNGKIKLAALNREKVNPKFYDCEL